MSGRARARLSTLLRSEQGVALPMAMIITVIALGLAAVPIMASVSSQGGGTNNQRGNEALAAAEAGAERAVLTQSELATDPLASLCVPPDLPDELSGWCPASPSLTSIGSAGYRYQVRPCYGGGSDVAGCAEVIQRAVERAGCSDADGGGVIQVVSTGESNGVKKRIEVTACANATVGPPGDPTDPVPIPPPNVFAAGQIIGIDWLNMHNDAQVHNGGAGSNGWVKMVGSSNVCGSVSHGTTFTTDNSSSLNPPPGCTIGRTASQGTADYPAIDLPEGIAASNSNSRLAGADPVGPGVWQRGNISWNASNRHLTISYDQLTLEGTLPYFLCKLTLAGGSKLLSGSGKSIRIFFDAPANCPGLNGTSQLQIANGAYVGADANQGPGFYFVGSETAGQSRIELGGGADVSQFVVYAPNSSIVANNGVNLHGAIIGRTLDLGGGADINPSGPFTPPPVEDFIDSEMAPGVPDPPDPNVTVERGLFVECSAEPGPSGDPDSGC